MHKEEIIRGQEPIREAIEEWRRFLIEQWRDEPLRLTQVTPYGASPQHIVEFQGGRRAWFGYLDHGMRYPLYWGCNLVAFMDRTEVPEKRAIGLYDFDPREVEKLRTIYRITDTLPAIYDPVLLLFWHLVDSDHINIPREQPAQPVSTLEIVTRSEALFLPRTPQDALEIGWIRLNRGWYPIEVLTLARERI